MEDHRAGEVARMIGVEPAGFRERHRRPVDEYEFCHGVEFTDPDGRARGRDVLGDRRVGCAEDPDGWTARRR